MVPNKLSVMVIGSQAQVMWTIFGREPCFSPFVPFEISFNGMDDLKWYTIGYRGDPKAESKKRAKQVERDMQNWGKHLFQLIFMNPRNPEASRLFFEAVHIGLDRCELVISSDDPAVLNMPWELIYSPQVYYLVPQLNGMYRTLRSCPRYVPISYASQGCLNILLIVSRPRNDIEPRILALPLLRTLQPMMRKGRARLKILRPPSFAEFERELSNNKGAYHIVHFDGHGTLGKLVFEKKNGSPDLVRAERIAHTLRNCRVPIFILDACYSGLLLSRKSSSAEQASSKAQVPLTDLSIASELIRLGTKAVVAMAYAVRVDASREFMLRFYTELMQGKAISPAVSAGRRQMMTDPDRSSKFGPFSLQDWMIPVLFQQEQYTPFVVQRGKGHKSGFRTCTGASESISEKGLLVGLPNPGPFRFIGRELEMMYLERRYRHTNVVLLRGGKGVGKTEMACEWARWLVRTLGRDKVFYTSSKERAGLREVIMQIGLNVMGGKFRELGSGEQQGIVVSYLRRHPCLVIWDRFESVDRTSKEEELSSFLHKLRHGQTWVLIISRDDAKWLQYGYDQHFLGGFDSLDSVKFAREVFSREGLASEDMIHQVGRGSAQVSKGFGVLLKILGGNPLCLQEEIPKLLHMSLDDLTADLIQKLTKTGGTMYVPGVNEPVIPDA